MAKRKRQAKTNLTKRDVRRYFGGAYKYFIKKQGLVKLTSRKQPIITKTGKNTFIVTSPFKVFNQRIAFVFAPQLTQENSSYYVLVSAISPRMRWGYIKKIKQDCSKQIYHKWISFLRHLLIQYQIGTLKDGTYYIRIEDYSIKDAYYRFIMFELSYYQVISFLLW